MTRQLTTLDLVSPGFLGLNLLQAGSLLPPVYATKAQDVVIDRSGRLAARKGYSDLTTTDITSTPAVETIHEYVQKDGTTEIIVAWDGGIANDVADPEGNDISGSVTDTSGRWSFANFNDKCIGFQSGQKPIVYTGTGNFTTVSESSGTAPDGGIGTAAFGRVWCVDADRQTVQYSGLLDETDWNTTGDSGSIDMSNVWTDGTDVVTAIAAFNGALVVFGRNHIVFWVDGQGSALGLDPDNIYVSDVITGTGCVSDLTLAPVGETDLLFLSPNGVQSLKRVVQERSNPVITLSKLVRDELLFDLDQETEADIRAAYNPLEGFYLLSFPSRNRAWCFDQRRRYRDQEGDELSVVTTWTLAPTALATVNGTDLYFGDTYGVGQYGGVTDAGDTIRYVYQSPWLDLGEQVANQIKILKRIGAIVFTSANTQIVFKWWVDFQDEAKSATKTISDVGGAAEWGDAEWGEDEWGGGLALALIKFAARARGQYFRIGLEADVDGSFAVQQSELQTKVGRLA